MAESLSTPRRPRILLVDDEEKSLKYFRLAFGDRYEIFTAASAAAGMEILVREGGEVDVVIADQRMPGQTGQSFLAEVRQRFPRASRILTSANDMKEVLVKGFNERTFAGFLEKPWSAQEATHLLELCLREQRYLVLALGGQMPEPATGEPDGDSARMSGQGEGDHPPEDPGEPPPARPPLSAALVDSFGAEIARAVQFSLIPVGVMIDSARERNPPTSFSKAYLDEVHRHYSQVTLVLRTFMRDPEEAPAERFDVVETCAGLLDGLTLLTASATIEAKIVASGEVIVRSRREVIEEALRLVLFSLAVESGEWSRYRFLISAVTEEEWGGFTFEAHHPRLLRATLPADAPSVAGGSEDERLNRLGPFLDRAHHLLRLVKGTMDLGDGPQYQGYLRLVVPDLPAE